MRLLLSKIKFINQIAIIAMIAKTDLETEFYKLKKYQDAQCKAFANLNQKENCR